MSDYDALLTSEGIVHTLGPSQLMAHNWDSGWVPRRWPLCIRTVSNSTDSAPVELWAPGCQTAPYRRPSCIGAEVGDLSREAVTRMFEGPCHPQGSKQIARVTADSEPHGPSSRSAAPSRDGTIHVG